jgi:hypothetical protein
MWYPIASPIKYGWKWKGIGFGFKDDVLEMLLTKPANPLNPNAKKTPKGETNKWNEREIEGERNGEDNG